MHNVNDGTGTLETRIKLVRDQSLGTYSFDGGRPSGSTLGVNDYSTSQLMLELNGDYLNYNLGANTNWYTSNSNKNAEFDYTKALSASAQSLIDDAVWYLGSFPNRSYPTSQLYQMERGSTVWGSTAGQNCSDPSCPRATSWTGKVGLMYTSDLGFQVGGTVRESCLTNNYSAGVTCSRQPSWKFENMGWLITGGSNSYSAVYNASIAYHAAANTQTVYPSVYLKPNVTISGGNGSKTSPYTFALSS